jgi:hypothetical protein
MRKPDEIQLYALLRQAPLPDRDLVESTALKLGIQYNRLHGLLTKWANRGWWNYGVSLRCGWFEKSAADQLFP